MSTNNDNSSSNEPPSSSTPPSGDSNSDTGSPSPPPPPPSSSPPPPEEKSSPPPEEKSSPPPPSNNNNSPPSSDKKSPPPNNNNDKSSQTPSKSDSSNSKNSNSPPSSTPSPPSPPGSYRGALAPPTDKSTSPNTEHTSHNASSNEKVIIAGVAAGAGFLLIVMIICLVSCARRRKRKKHNEMQYYRNNSPENIGSDYYNSGGWHNKAQSNEYGMKMPPSAQVSSEYGWPAQPPPPLPPMMNSSQLGSANFSGSQYPSLPPQHTSMSLGFNQSSFSYDDLASATGGFSNSNLLGQGGFGYVHKGVLQNGKEVAIKSLKANSGQGEREFQAEVDIISRVHHRHLVSLVGYCIAGSQRMLVYDFVPNNTLEHHLHGKASQILDWPTRLKIALGSAKGFAYLHEDCHPRIIHRDIKVANILLDDNFDAQVADFGLAKLSSDTQSHVSTRIMGTFGYMAPEYASSGKLTEKSDVYSYGVVLLELITGKRPIDIHSEDEDTLVDWAMPILSRAIDGGSYEEIVDPRLERNYDPQEMLAMIACAAACIRQSSRRRPKMSQIVRALEGDMSIDALNEGMKNGNSSTFGYGSGSEYGSQTDLKKLGKTTDLSSQDFTSSEK